MNIGVNTFGLRGPFYRDREGALKSLREMGITSLEVCVFFPTERTRKAAEAPAQEPPPKEGFDYAEARAVIWGSDAALERIDEIRTGGSKVFSAHAMADIAEPGDLLELIPQLRDFSRKTGIRTIVYSPSRSGEELLSFAPAFNEICSELQRDGIRFLLHNHEAECAPIGEKTSLELLMEKCPLLGLELDVGWAKFAGADPIVLMDSLRPALLHLKDISQNASAENRDTCCIAVGEGSIPLREILIKARELGLDEDALIIDQDWSGGDIMEDIRRGAENIRRLGE